MQERRVRLFKNGQNQAVRIPREFELPGHEAIMRKDGERLIIEPVAGRSLLARCSLCWTFGKVTSGMTRPSPRSKTRPPSRSTSDGLPARHQHRLGLCAIPSG